MGLRPPILNRLKDLQKRITRPSGSVNLLRRYRSKLWSCAQTAAHWKRRAFSTFLRPLNSEPPQTPSAARLTLLKQSPTGKRLNGPKRYFTSLGDRDVQHRGDAEHGPMQVASPVTVYGFRKRDRNASKTDLAVFLSTGGRSRSGVSGISSVSLLMPFPGCFVRVKAS